MKRYFYILVFMMFCIGSSAREWISYGCTKRIAFSNGVKSSESRENGTLKYAFEGNRLYQESVIKGYMTVYGIYEGVSNGNLYYSVWNEGMNFTGQYVGPNKLDDQYFLVSPDKNTINLVLVDNIGRPSIIYVYEKATTAPIDRIYK